jgi:UDP-N-acetylmuramate--alanine ligase
VAVVTNVDLDHHVTFASRAEVAAFFDEWLASADVAVRGEELEPVELPLGIPGEHNRRNAATALVTLCHMGFDRSEAERVIVEYRGAGRRFERRGEASGVAVYDDYAHHPAEVAVAIAAARQVHEGRLLVLFQPHLYSRTRYLAHEFGAALAGADVVAVTDVYPAREAPVPGVTGKLLVDAVCDTRPGATVGWTPSVDQGVEFVVRHASAGDLVLTMGAGDVDRAAPAVLARLGGGR